MLALVLLIALIVDVMKPATLGFVMPGLIAEYRISRTTAGWLPFFALTGTTIGSILWGRAADVFGRRAAILLSALMFIGTAICGAMPSFQGNLLMCFLMGASAGGLLPIVFTLMAETVPAAHRGWLLVTLGGIGTTAGYLVAAGAASLLEPYFSWRMLWFLGLPTGALLLFLNRYIPESPRFLVLTGLEKEARSVLAKFSVQADHDDAAPVPPAGKRPDHQESSATRQLMNGVYGPITLSLFMCGLAWGLVNFGFLLWLPFNLVHKGMDASAASSLLACSAILSLPGMTPVVLMYHRWSSVKTLVLFIVLTIGGLLAFVMIELTGIVSNAAMIGATALLLISASGIIAVLIPYAAEIYPVHLRGSGSGVVAASSKFGGIVGAVFGIAGVFNDFTVPAFIIAAPMVVSVVMLLRKGIETRGRRLEDIHAALHQGSVPALSLPLRLGALMPSAIPAVTASNRAGIGVGQHGAPP
jgi:putative MFS transporter